jgi:hypothetical protein
MGESRMRFWLLALFALSVTTLYVTAPAPSHAQVLVGEQPGGPGDGGGPDLGDPDQPNFKTRSPQAAYSTISLEPRAGRSLEPNGAKVVEPSSGSPYALMRRSFELLYWSLRARWGW